MHHWEYQMKLVSELMALVSFLTMVSEEVDTPEWKC